MAGQVIEVIELPNGYTKRIFEDGREIVYDQNGAFAPGGYMPPELAKKTRQAREIRKGGQFQADVDELLTELGLSLDSVYNRQAAEIYLKGAAGAIPAARELVHRSRSTGAVSYTPPEPGQACGLCGKVFIPDWDWSPEAITGAFVVMVKPTPGIAAAVRQWLDDGAYQERDSAQSENTMSNMNL